MPPKEVKKTTVNVVRPPISNSSLLWVPTDAVEGYRERLEQCVEWTLSGSTIRHHWEVCSRENIPPLSFSEAVQNKIRKSFLRGFLDEESTLTLSEHYDVTIPIALWDTENCNNEKQKICFRSCNYFTDNLLQLVKNAVMYNDREVLKTGLKNALVLRINNCKMTYLDEHLEEYKHLTTLSLCGNYLDEVNCKVLPPGLRALEMQANRISSLESFANLPDLLLYLGLAKNLLTSEGITPTILFPRTITVLDFSDNDIYELSPLLDVLVKLPNLISLLLYGNPCSVCAGYALTILSRLQRLKWLDNRKVLPTDRPLDEFEPHPDDLRSAYFNFTILRIISAPVPPKPEKGQTATFHVELELPLLDSLRRTYLMYGRNESLVQLQPPAEDYNESNETSVHETESVLVETVSEDSDIFAKLKPKNSRLIKHYTCYESNRIPWNKVMNFQEPTVRIFCPDLKALRDTFRSVITLRLIYALLTPPMKTKDKPKNGPAVSVTSPSEQFVTIATIKCSLKCPDWSQSAQHFHWDDTLNTKEAIHWGDGDLTAVQYNAVGVKMPKQKAGQGDGEKVTIPENLTCHFGFGIETLRA